MITTLEQPLSPYSACNLGSINLSAFVPKPFESSAFNTEDFQKAVRIAIRALDKVLDENLENHALPEQRQKSIDYRNIGLGIMGLADALIMMGLRYGSVQAQIFCETIMQLMFETAIEESIALAKEKGAFPKYDGCIWKSDIIKRNISEATIKEGLKYGLRNCSLLSIAPTGSLATLLNGISGGCEPYFAFEYNRTTKSLNGGEDKTYKQYAPVVYKYRKVHPEGPLPNYFVTSENISWKERIAMQASLQISCDTAISSTVNLPENTSKEEIEKLYLYAWERGLKGITVFRSGCKRVAILSTEKPEEPREEVHTVKWTPIRKVSDDCIGKKRTLVTGCGTLHVIACFDRNTGQLLETYCAKGSKGGCSLFMNGLSRMMSLAARGNISIEAIVDQLKSAGTCPSYAVRTATKHDTSKGSCCPTAIGYALVDMYNEMQDDLNYCLGIRNDAEEIEYITAETLKQMTDIQLPSPHEKPKCPKCGEALIAQGGCFSCHSCGYSRCD